MTGVVYDSINIGLFEDLSIMSYKWYGDGLITESDIKEYTQNKKRSYENLNNQLLFSCEYKDGMKNGEFVINYIGFDFDHTFFSFVELGFGKLLGYWYPMYWGENVVNYYPYIHKKKI